MTTQPQTKETTAAPPKRLEQDAVLIKKTESDTDTNGRPYLAVYDGFNMRWNLFGELSRYKFQADHGYLFKYERNGIYKNVKVIEPLSNIFEVAALRKLADISEYKKDVGVALRFSTDLIIAGKLEMNQLYAKTDEILKYLDETSQRLMNKDVK